MHIGKFSAWCCAGRDSIVPPPVLDENDRVTPRLQRIPSGDAVAEETAATEILVLARAWATADLLGCLVRRDATALARYGVRQTTRALRTRSAATLHDAILALAISDIIHEDDWRDTLVGLAPCYYVAQQLGQDPAQVFDAAVSGLPDDRVCGLFHGFGAREDVTLEAFGWQLVQTDDGPDFEFMHEIPPERIQNLVREAAQRRRNYLEGTFGTEGAAQIERSNAKLFSAEAND